MTTRTRRTSWANDAQAIRARMLEAERAAVRCREKGMEQLADQWAGRARAYLHLAQKIEAARGDA